MKRLLLLLLLIFLCTPAFSEDTNYCYNDNSWKEWDTIARKYPDDMDIQILHAVRIGFCKKIEDGTISFEDARETFQLLHESLINKAVKEQNQELQNKHL
jgi:hypothetical protein